MSKIIFVGNPLIPYEEFESGTIEDCIEWLKNQTIIAADTETSRAIPKNTYDERVYRPGLDPYFTKICMLQLGSKNIKFIIDARVIDIRVLKPYLENSNILKVLHNAKFDFKQLYHIGIELNNVWDTMICENILYCGMPYSYSMEACGIRNGLIKKDKIVNLFDDIDEEVELFKSKEDLLFSLMDGKEEAVYVDKSIRTQFVEWGDKPFTVEQIRYGASDLDIPLKLYEIQKKGRIIDGELYLPTKAFEIENKLTTVLGKMEYRGMYLDKQQWMSLYDSNMKIYIQKLEELNTFVECNYPSFATNIGLFTGKSTCNIEWSSSKQVIKFFRFLNICPKEKSKSTKKVEWTVGAKSMFKLLSNENKELFYESKTIPFNAKDNQSIILNYLVMRKYQMLTTTFGKSFLRWVHPTQHMVFCSFRQIMSTGRLSCTSPNLQNIPSGKVWRKCFVAGKGNIMISSDFASQESRILSSVGGSQVLADFFIKGDDRFKDDLHSYVATKMFSVMRNQPNLLITKETGKKERQIAKSLNFGISYGASEYSVSGNLGITLEEAKEFIEGFFAGFPGLKDNFENTKKQVLKRGWIELEQYTGKRYFFSKFEELQSWYEKAMSLYPSDWKSWSKESKKEWSKEEKEKNPLYGIYWKEYMGLKGSLERKGLNYRIQGSASTQSKLASIFLEEELGGLVNFVHDEAIIILPYVSDENNEIIAKKVKECMIRGASLVTTNVPMDASVDIGNFWIH